jgi:hypothetical protein
MLSAECFAPTIAPPNPNNQQIAVTSTCLDTWNLCVVAIAGLVGGRMMIRLMRDSLVAKQQLALGIAQGELGFAGVYVEAIDLAQNLEELEFFIVGGETGPFCEGEIG